MQDLSDGDTAAISGGSAAHMTTIDPSLIPGGRTGPVTRPALRPAPINPPGICPPEPPTARW